MQRNCLLCFLWLSQRVLTSRTFWLTAKSETVEKNTTEDIERLQSQLEGRELEAQSLLADKDRQLHNVVSEYEEKLSAAGELLRQRETELLAQVCG